MSENKVEGCARVWGGVFLATLRPFRLNSGGFAPQASLSTALTFVTVSVARVVTPHIMHIGSFPAHR